MHVWLIDMTICAKKRHTIKAALGFMNLAISINVTKTKYNVGKNQKKLITFSYGYSNILKYSSYDPFIGRKAKFESITFGQKTSELITT